MDRINEAGAVMKQTGGSMEISSTGSKIPENANEGTVESWMDSLPPEAKEEIRKARSEAARWRVLARKTGKEQLIDELEALKKEINERDSDEGKTPAVQAEPETRQKEGADYKTLYETAEKEIAGMEAKHNEELAKLKAVAEEYEAERAEMVQLLPGEMRDAFRDSSRKQLQILLGVVGRAAGSPGAKNGARYEQDIEAMSLDEQLRLNAENPELFNQLKAKQFQKKRQGG